MVATGAAALDDDGFWLIIDRGSGLALSVITSDDRGDVTLKPVGSGSPGTEDAQAWKIGMSQDKMWIVSRYSERCLTSAFAGPCAPSDFPCRLTTARALGEACDWKLRVIRRE